MTQEDWTKMNKESHYNSLIKQDTANRQLIKKLQLEKEALKKQLLIQRVVSSALTESDKEDIGWIYCPNCGRVKEDS